MEENKATLNKYKASEPVTDESEVTLSDLFREMMAKWKWYVVSVVLCLLVATLYILRATPIYTRSTEVLLKDDTSQSISGDLSLLGLNPVPSELLNEMFIMSSPEIMEQVVDRLNLNEVYTTPKGLRKEVLYNSSPVSVEIVDSLSDMESGFGFNIKLADDGKSATLSKFQLAGVKVKAPEMDVRLGEVVKTPVGTLSLEPTKFLNPEVPEGEEAPEVPRDITFSYSPAAATARGYCGSLQSEYAEDRGNVITLTISCPSPKMASDILTTLVDAYNERWVADRNKIALATSKFIDERLVSIEQELGDVEANITDYKSSHRMMDMEAMASLYLTQSSENQRQLQELAQEIAIGRYIRSELAKGDITRLLPATAEIGGTNIQTMVTEYNKLVAARNLKLETMPEESPVLRQKTEAIERTREAIIASVDAALTSLNKRYDAIAMVDNRTQQHMASAPGQAKYLMSEERKQKVKESLYLFLLQRREENELSQAFAVYNTRMVTPPYGPGAPTSPNKKLILMLAVLIGLLVPTLIIYLREITNTKVRSRKDIEDMPMPFLGEVPLADVPQHGRFYTGRKNGAVETARKIVVRPHQGDTINEAFRMIRTNIDFMGAMSHKENGEGKVIMVVSMNAGSGKTFVSLNTAAIFSLKDKKTCLVDLDLRKGTVSKNVGSPRRGVVDYLIGRETNLESLIVHNVDGFDNLDVLPEGIIPPNPTEMLYNHNLRKMIEQLRKMYDYVIIDCPPVEIVADARLLNPFVDLTIFVVRSGLFEKADLATLREMYRERRYNNLALILNATDSLHGVYGSYGYGYGYHKKPSKNNK